ncbi:MAG TPA: DUF2147 domain-containing protein [Burkholderiaceae bacterium]
MRNTWIALAATAALALAAPSFAQSPVGVWKTIDDATGKPKSLVRISESGGQYSGKIEKLFRPAGEDQNPKCDKCTDARKDQPIIGMTILSGLKADGDEYTGGEIVDPNNGKTYKAKLKVEDGGKKLNMRGYIGMPMLGRTQTWLREE